MSVFSLPSCPGLGVVTYSRPPRFLWFLVVRPRTRYQTLFATIITALLIPTGVDLSKQPRTGPKGRLATLICRRWGMDMLRAGALRCAWGGSRGWCLVCLRVCDCSMSSCETLNAEIQNPRSGVTVSDCESESGRGFFRWRGFLFVCLVVWAV